MKYKLTDQIYEYNGVKLRRIQASNSFGEIAEGELGGWVEGEKNLSQKGSCWIADRAVVYGQSSVTGNARVYDRAKVYDRAVISGDARVYGDSWVYGNAVVSGEAKVCGYSRVGGDSWVGEKAWLPGNALLRQDQKAVGIVPQLIGFGKFGISLFENEVNVGCLTFSYDDFENGKAQEFAKIHGYSDMEFQYLRELFRFHKAFFNRQKQLGE